MSSAPIGLLLRIFTSRRSPDTFYRFLPRFFAVNGQAAAELIASPMSGDFVIHSIVRSFLVEPWSDLSRTLRMTACVCRPLVASGSVSPGPLAHRNSEATITTIVLVLYP